MSCEGLSFLNSWHSVSFACSKYPPYLWLEFVFWRVKVARPFATWQAWRRSYRKLEVALQQANVYEASMWREASLSIFVSRQVTALFCTAAHRCIICTPHRGHEVFAVYHSLASAIVNHKTSSSRM